METTTATKPLTKKQQAERDKQEAIAHLRRVAPPGSTIYGIVRDVARSGMSRTIDFYVPTVDAYGEKSMQYLTGWFATVLGWKRTPQGALKVSGCGMDMIFHTVYSAGWATWKDSDAPEYLKRNGKQNKGKDRDAGYVWRSSQL